MQVRHQANDEAFRAPPRHPSHPMFTAAEGCGSQIETKPRLLFFGAMALKTSICEERGDVSSELNRARRCGREGRGVRNLETGKTRQSDQDDADA